MKKLNYLLFLLLSSLSFLSAKDVDQAMAAQVAKNFYLQNNSNVSSLTGVELVYECKTNAGVGRLSDNKPVYYIFNMGAGNGFVIVSGDDLVRPVLGYGTETAWVMSDLAPAASKWLDNYKQQIVFVKENVFETTPEISDLWYKYYNNITVNDGSRAAQAVNPLCATRWNQSPYENALCPYDAGYGERAVTGCVATAMAQVMKFWNYPTQGTGFHSYNDQHYGSQSANFGSTTYNWAGMPNILNSSNANVATLMYHCGVSVDMGYGVGATGGSSAYVVASQSPVQACAEYSYKTYFGYDPSTLQGVVRQNYSDVNWMNLMKTELNAGRPMQYAGFGNGGGHTWVCDGYDNNDYLHMNWGWGGNSDGYFFVNNLDPSSLGAGGGTGGFNSGQQAVIGIKPLNGGGGGTINQSSIQLYSATTVSANPFQTGGSFSVYADIANLGSSDFTGDFAAALFNSDGVFVQYIQEFTGATAQAGYHYNTTFTANPLELIPGTYYIGVYYKNGSNNYSLIDEATFSNPVSITVTGPANQIEMYSNTTVTPSTIVKNASFDITNQIWNNSVSNFTGYVSADLFTLDGTYVTTIDEVSVNMTANYYYNFTFSSTGLSVDPGTYYVAFFSSPDQTNWTLVYNGSYPNPITVTITDAALSPDVYESDNTEGTAYSLPVTFSGNSASTSTTGSNMHVGNDFDYYKVTLPAGTNYSIIARVHDSYSSGNGNTYTNDAQLSYKVNGGNFSDAYDDVLPAAIYVPGGGTVVFFVSNYFSGSTGTYLLDLQVTRGANVGISDVSEQKLSVFPNPASEDVFVDASNQNGNYTLQLFNQLGEQLMATSGSFNSQLIKLNVRGVPAGVYTIQLTSAGKTLNSKLIVR